MNNSKNVNIQKVYLAGAVRGDHLIEDVGWRQRAIEILQDVAIIINPVAGKQYNATGVDKWTMHGRRVYSRTVTFTDLWHVRNCDMIIANLKPMAEGYPSVGTIFELATAHAYGKLIYTIVVPGVKVHDTDGDFDLHPFIKTCSAASFTEVEECLWFARAELLVASGASPAYGRVGE
jgi:nucleoside 2-deoxyribosyltransferase